MNILGCTRVDEQIVLFEHRLSDGEELLKGLQTCVSVVEVDVIRVLSLKRHIGRGDGGLGIGLTTMWGEWRYMIEDAMARKCIKAAAQPQQQ